MVEVDVLRESQIDECVGALWAELSELTQGPPGVAIRRMAEAQVTEAHDVVDFLMLSVADKSPALLAALLAVKRGEHRV